MDLLTDLLQQAGLRRRLLNLRSVDSAIALQFPCDKSLGLHVVTKGSIYIHGPSLSEPLKLNAGDIAVMARGCNHYLSTQASISTQPIISVEQTPSQPLGPGSADELSSLVISGAYQFWNTPIHPFFREIPDWFVIRSHELPEHSPLVTIVSLLHEEMHQHELGAETIVHGLLDVIFTYLLRAMVQRLGTSAANWSQAVSDPQVRKALSLMHADCARAWSLEELASTAGLSRTGLAERFRHAMGDTPLNHLRALRMQKAMKILSETDKTLLQVATEVGYQDAFNFSKVFKRTVGITPREFRRKNNDEMASIWRLKTG